MAEVRLTVRPDVPPARGAGVGGVTRVGTIELPAPKPLALQGLALATLAGLTVALVVLLADNPGVLTAAFLRVGLLLCAFCILLWVSSVLGLGVGPAQLLGVLRMVVKALRSAMSATGGVHPGSQVRPREGRGPATDDACDPARDHPRTSPEEGADRVIGAHWTGNGGRTAICLSGGGLRAASFSLGVLQALQRERGLLYGPNAAEWLAAVSGGSYIASSYVLGGRQRAADPGRYRHADPLAPGSPEEGHILTHGRYLCGAPWRWPWLWLLTFSSLVVLFIWFGFITADWSVLSAWIGGGVVGPLANVPIPAVVLVFVSLTLLVGSLYADSPWRRAGTGLLGIGGMLAFSEPAITWAAAQEVFTSGRRLTSLVALAVAALIGLGVLTLILRKMHGTGAPGWLVNAGSGVAVRALGFLVVAAIAAQFHPDILAVFDGDQSGDAGRFAVAIASVLVAPLLFSGLPERASLHREYRRRLASCFGIARGPAGEAEWVPDEPLSTMPPATGPVRFPRLLVCATANVRRRGPTRRLWRFRPFLLTHETCGVPGDGGAEFLTEKLELGLVPAGLLSRRKEPLISLFTAVAATGAAVSPSMGRYTVPSMRPLIALANFRLGRWVPNPYSRRARAAVAKRTTPGPFRAVRNGLGRGYDELIPEIFGLDGPQVYVSDGGHYDNLGLTGVLRKEPETIWCIDASPDPHGRASELRRVCSLARGELNVDIRLDADVFKASGDRLYPATHAVGEVVYPSGKRGWLLVLKLGLQSDSPEDLLARRRRRGFPYHPTWRQVYGKQRMDAYRRLGCDVAERALTVDGAT